MTERLSDSSVATVGVHRRRPSSPCLWCGRPVVRVNHAGRPRRYCGQSCRQRAYEQRRTLQRDGLPADAAVLSAGELADLTDRLFQLRCAAEDLLTATADGAATDELTQLANEIVAAARAAEHLRANTSQ